MQPGDLEVKEETLPGRELKSSTWSLFDLQGSLMSLMCVRSARLREGNSMEQALQL